jgi:hypothetical protein
MSRFSRRQPARMSLDDLVGQLTALFAERLHAVVLYGMAARPDAPPGAEQNVLILVDAIDPGELAKLGETTRAWGEAGNPPPLAFTLADWRRSADVFPMEYADILAAHRLLHGALPGDGIVVDRADLRLEAEREAMSKVLRLRQGVMHAGGDPARQADLLRASFPTILACFRAALRVAGAPSEGPAAEVITRAAALAGFEAAPFERTRIFVEARDELSNKETGTLLAGELAGMNALVAWLDASDASGPVTITHPA